MHISHDQCDLLRYECNFFCQASRQRTRCMPAYSHSLSRCRLKQQKTVQKQLVQAGFGSTELTRSSSSSKKNDVTNPACTSCLWKHKADCLQVQSSSNVTWTGRPQAMRQLTSLCVDVLWCWAQCTRQRLHKCQAILQAAYQADIILPRGISSLPNVDP